MQEERIYLFDDSLQDHDAIAFGDIVYKVEKIRSIFRDLLRATYNDLAVYLRKQEAYKFGLCYSDGSLGELYSEEYCGFEYLTVGSSNWKTGEIKIYVSAFLYSNQSQLKEQFESGCYYPQMFFNDDDIISLREDCFCKMQPIKKVFKSISSSFGSIITRELVKSIADFNGSDLFMNGKECELLRLGSLSWEKSFIGIQLTIDARKNDLIQEEVALLNSSISPLDEIRKTAESYPDCLLIDKSA